MSKSKVAVEDISLEEIVRLGELACDPKQKPAVSIAAAKKLLDFAYGKEKK